MVSRRRSGPPRGEGSSTPATTPAPAERPSLPRLRLLAPLSLLYAGGRLVPAGAAGAGVFLLLPAGFRPADRLTAAWIIGVAVFLGLTALAVIGAAPQRLRERA